jgi:hypothetical protein
MRFALAHGKWSILAEVALNGEVAAAMRGAFDRVVAGLSLAVAQAREGEAPTEPNQQDAEAQDQLGGSLALPISKDHLTKDQIADVLALSTIAEEDIVDLDTAWEVRTRWHEDAVPVRVSIDADRLRFRRVLLPKLPAAEQALPVAHHALRLNSQLRQCRLAAVENRIVAETCLSAAEVDAKSVVTAARAIAVASRHCSSSLAVLAAQPGLAGRYQEIFFRS